METETLAQEDPGKTTGSDIANWVKRSCRFFTICLKHTGTGPVAYKFAATRLGVLESPATAHGEELILQPLQQPRELSDIGSYPPRFIACELLELRSVAFLIL